VFIAIVLSLIPHDMQYGPQAALIAEAFTPRLRYSGASLGYQLASVIAGGPAPLIATALFAAYQTGYAVAIYIAACAVVSLVAVACLTTREKIFRWSTTTNTSGGVYWNADDCIFRECPLWSNRGQTRVRSDCPLSANSGHMISSCQDNGCLPGASRWRHIQFTGVGSMFCSAAR
jgi:hypothetical protein